MNRKYNCSNKECKNLISFGCYRYGSGKCKSCANRTRIIIKDEKVYKKQKLKKKDWYKKYYQNNKDTINRRNLKWQKEHKKECKQIQSKYIINNSDKWLFYSIRSRCSNKGIILEFNLKSFCDWYAKQKRECVYCKISEKEWVKGKDSLLKKFKKLQVDRIVPKKGYALNNVVLACPRCNFTKSDFFTFHDMKKIGRLIRATTKYI